VWIPQINIFSINVNNMVEGGAAKKRVVAKRPATKKKTPVKKKTQSRRRRQLRRPRLRSVKSRDFTMGL
jgi:hypothetical protein